jgi:hypothetical protein
MKSRAEERREKKDLTDGIVKTQLRNTEVKRNREQRTESREQRTHREREL